MTTIDSRAWKALSHGARSLYVALRRRYSLQFRNNGHIYLSQRAAEEEIGSHHNEIARWFRELQFYGFIVMTKGGSLGVEGKGKAPHWRLTELGYMTDLPTRDFERWRGAKFVDRKTKPRAPFPAHSVREMAHTQVREMAHTNRRKRDGNGAHTATADNAEIQHISSLTTPRNCGAHGREVACTTSQRRTAERWATERSRKRAKRTAGGKKRKSRA